MWAKTGAWTQMFCVLISAAFAGFAFSLRAVSRSGAVAGFLICVLLCVGAGLSTLGPLAAVFILAWLTTRFGSTSKERMGTAETNEGRNAFQLVANLGVAAVCAVLFFYKKDPIFSLAIAASLSEAVADTVSSEIGQLSSAVPRLITTWKQVPVGTDGGVTVLGTLAGLTGAVVVSVVSSLCGIVTWNRIWVPILAAFMGMMADSFLGAWLERRNLLSNDMVNFLGTLLAAFLSIVI